MTSHQKLFPAFIFGNIRTTRIYAKIVDEDKRKAVNLVPKI